MSQESGTSSGTSARERGRVFGIPKKCWCGEQIVAKQSKSDPNPGRRYYRCAYAFAMRLTNDAHVFKWFDEAIINEKEKLEWKIECLESEVEKLKSAREVFDEEAFEKMGVKIENELVERVEDIVSEAKAKMKKLMVLVVIGCLAMVVTAILAIVKDV